MRLSTRSILALFLALAGSSPDAAGQPRELGTPPRAVVLANVDPVILAPRLILPAPLVFAHGNLGIPRVITWATTTGVTGIAWGTTSAITAANAYVTYNATNMVLNVPTATGILFQENQVTHVSIAATGAVLLDGTDDVVQLTVQGFSTQTTLPFVVEDSAGVDQFTVSNVGAVVALGTLTLTGDATLNGGVGALGFGAGETIVPADALLNVTGGAEFTTTADAATYLRSPSVFANNIRLRDGASLVLSDNDANPFVTFTDTGAGGTGLFAGAQLVDGAANVVQLTVQGFSTQTTLPFVVENSAGTDVFTVSNAGGATLSSSLSFTDANVLLAESGTNDLSITADGSVEQIITSTETTFGGNINFSNADSRIRSDDSLNIENIAAARWATISATAANPTGLAGQISAAHISGGGGSTTGAATGTGCGTPSLPTQSGNDIGGTLGATCGTAGTTTNPFVTITFADAYSTAPFCTIDGANAATVAGTVLSQHVAVTTTTTLQVNCGGGTCTTGALSWAYHCSQ